MKDNGSTRAWRTLRAKVLREEPTCRIQGPGCTHISDTVDHIHPRSIRPDLAMVRRNLRGACAHCNYSRGNGTKQRGTNQPAKRPAALDLFFNPRRNTDDGPPTSLGA